MPGITQNRFHSTIKGPAAEALDILGARSKELLAAWSAKLNGLGLRLAEYFPGGALDFSSLAERLRASSFGSFREQIRKLGRHLADRGVRLDTVIAALDRLFELALGCLEREAPHRAMPLLALARLHALITLLLVSGYTGRSAGRRTTLIEESMREAQQRSHDASAYVTKIYERERRRLSHDLHDEIGHDLILIKLYLEMISLSVKERNIPDIQPRLNEAIGVVSHSIDAVRRLVLDLGPAVFDELGFLPAVKSYASQFSSHTGIHVTVHEGYLPENVPLTHQIALYRLLQGALSNVLKHAHARNVNISLGSRKDSVLIMVVEDDGIGFDPGAKPGRRSFGLTAMRERVEVLGGRIHVESRRAVVSRKKHGTRIEVDLPLPGGEAEEG